eukprot:13686638-Alexandrium_andersonii.AAC.1
MPSWAGPRGPGAGRSVRSSSLICFSVASLVFAAVLWRGLTRACLVPLHGEGTEHEQEWAVGGAGQASALAVGWAGSGAQAAAQ